MESLLLLHGAIGASSQLLPLAKELKSAYDVHTLNFTGHGGRADNGSPFSIGLFAKDVLQFLDEQQMEKVAIFGYSMGGYVGMYLARYHPERIRRVITLATKFSWDESIAARETQMLNPEKIGQKVPAFADALRKMHAPNDWRVLLGKTAEMMTEMGKDNPLKLSYYPAIQTPTLIMLGDRDKMVTLEETVAVYKALPAAQMAVLPNTPHPLEQADTSLIGFFIRRFLS